MSCTLMNRRVETGSLIRTLSRLFACVLFILWAIHHCMQCIVPGADMFVAPTLLSTESPCLESRLTADLFAVSYNEESSPKTNVHHLHIVYVAGCFVLIDPATSI